MTTRRPFRVLSPYRDVALAAALAILGLCELRFAALRADFHGPWPLNVVIVVLLALPVVWRRRAPVAALVAYWIPASIWLDAVYGRNSNLPLEPFLVLLVLVYSATAFADDQGLTVVRLVLAVLVVSEFALLADGRKGLGNVVPGLVFIGVAHLLGYGVRRRRAEATSLAERAASVEAERDEAARQAVASERDRIARELHDVIAHNVSAMVVQAGAGERLVGRDEERARQALGSIRETGADALDELRRLLGLLRDSDHADGGEPQPGLGRLTALIARNTAAGLDVTCTVVGAERPLPPGVDLAAYRIVQEALTNVRKHAAGARAEVTLRYESGLLGVRITDDGGEHTGADGAGHGLMGIRERVALYGGTMRCGALPGGGFEVAVELPITEATR